eukprot:COSAG01_NODE_31467_length_597_cov_0.819277_1_plen_20_part_10
MEREGERETWDDFESSDRIF